VSLSRTLSTVVFAMVLAGCAKPARTPDSVLGEWEKPDSSLPPINLVLSKDEGEIRARLRLSGVEANGTATVADTALRLTFPGRQEMIGEFISTRELKLRLDAAGPAFLLRKR
jgi:hypothetical protein